jgi:hypothetical protein
LMGDENFLEPEQLKRNVSSLIHHCWLHDQRTDTVVLECRANDIEYASSKRVLSNPMANVLQYDIHTGDDRAQQSRQCQVPERKQHNYAHS